MKDPRTICVHGQETRDSHVSNMGTRDEIPGIVTPVLPSTSFPYLDTEVKAYPRYFNTFNHDVLASKIAALELGEAAMVFSSGMAAISTAMVGFLKHGDHAVIQKGLYGGTTSFLKNCLKDYGVEFTFTEGNQAGDFEAAIRPETRVVYIETPSNPLLGITDIAMVADIARKHGLVSIIDNTFASPVNQNPIALGIDVVTHSATKYLGGHSDICAGAVITSNALMEPIRKMAKGFGGSLNAETCSLLERSLKTLILRVTQQNENANTLARWLDQHSLVDRVYYPGLEHHPGHEIAKAQMKGFGGMLSFELQPGMDAVAFQQHLRLIQPAMSLGGVESTICSSYLTSHASVSKEDREREGIKDTLLRLSVGIEGSDDLMEDLEQAMVKVATRENVK